MPAARNAAHLCYHLPLIRRQPAGAPPFHSSYKSYRREHSFFFFPASASRTVGQPQRTGVRQNDAGTGRRVARHPARARRARQGETGSGKTAAFGIGLLNNIVVAQVATAGAGALSHRELADQVSKELRRLARFTQNVKILTLCGGQPMGPQLDSLVHAPHIVVGTPGRIQEHLRKKNSCCWTN